MPYDYRKLRGKIIEVYETTQAFASAMKWSERTNSLKLNNKRSWKQQEIQRAIELLDLQKEDIADYFFKMKVQNIEQRANKKAG